ncbi:coiled-coil domain-containing protein 122 [Brachyhypopomus gauderio]|uniref:coiled-coil domain-containing protein 122 n=1 Tax=Brachyhypopomus gauderio TaxID=698409 RepID=UPI004042BF24
MSHNDKETFSDTHQEFSLSSALHAVSQQGECQAVELKEKQHILNSVQATLSEIAKRYETVASNVTLKEQQISSVTNETEQIQHHSKKLETQIHTLWTENLKLRHCIEEQSENSHFVLAGYNTYRNKMESYKMSVFALESQSPVYKELMEKREEVKRLKACRADLAADPQNPDGELVHQAQIEIENIKTKITCMKEIVRGKRKLLEKEKDTHAHLRKDIEIQNRRCDAIVKRLCCQLKQAQYSQRQLSSDVSQMEKEVEYLKSQLEVPRPT